MDTIQVFNLFLIIYTPLIWICVMKSKESKIILYSLATTCFLSHVNTYLKLVSLQQVLHAFFIFFILHASLISTCYNWRLLNGCMTFTMLALRHVYDSCVFLWWNRPPRNFDIDVVISIVFVIGLFREKKLTSIPMVACISIASHFISTDSSKDAFTTYFSFFH